MTTFILLLTLVFPNGTDATFILDHGLTQEDCAAEMATAPAPYAVVGTVVSYSCTAE